MICRTSSFLWAGRLSHDVAWLQGRDQASLQVDAKDLAIHRLVDDKGSGDSVVAQRRDEGGDLPVTVWNLADQALATAAAATQSRHVGRGAGLIDEDEAGWIKQPLLRFPDLAGHRHVGPILLGRVNAFFEADAAPVVEAPHRCHADRDAALAQQDPDFFKRDIRLCSDQVEQPRGMRLKPLGAVRPSSRH